MTNQTGGPAQAFVGRALRRREDPRLLVGRGAYIADLRIEGQVELMLLRSPHAHARVRAVDAAAALRHPGVLGVFTQEDLAGQVGDLPALDVRPGALPAFQPVLARGKVRWVGEAVAAILATSREVAEDAAELVDVQYELLPPLTGIAEAGAPGAPLLYEEFGTNTVQTFTQSVGDVDRAFAAADHVYRETFTVHRQTASPMETRGVLAQADPAAGTVCLWSSTQFPHRVRKLLADALRLTEDRVQVVAPDVGGGFGVKEAFYAEEILAAHLALRLGRPIRWLEDRREHFGASSHAREQRHEIAAAVTGDGLVTGLRSRVWTNIGGAFGSLSNAPGLYVSALLRGPYHIPCYSSWVYSVVTNKSPLNVYRGAGHPQAVLVMEQLMDRIARDLRIDRVALRLRNMIPASAMPSDQGVRLPTGEPVVYDSGDYPQCLRDAAALMKYEDFAAEQERLRRVGRCVGLGLSFYVEGTGFGPYETAGLRVDPQGAITLLTGSSPHGQGTATTHAQMVADELGIDPDSILILHGDTRVVKDGIGTWGSRGAAAGGSAAQLAGQRLKALARPLAARLLGSAEEALEWRDGRVAVPGEPGRACTWADLARAAGPGGLQVDVNFNVPSVAYAFAAHIAVVEVDLETGRIAVLRYGVAHDCGKIINPKIVAGQIVGGVAQGIGGTLFEEVAYGKDGGLLTQGLMEYLLPSVADIPPIEIIHRETPTPHNPLGIKGVGEGGTTGSTAAMGTAIQDALHPFGIRITDSGPFTPSKVLALLKAAGAHPP